MAFAHEWQWDLRDCSSLCNTCKENKKKEKWDFSSTSQPQADSHLWPQVWGGKKRKCEGPLVAPKVTVHSATVNSKKVASAKVNIF